MFKFFLQKTFFRLVMLAAIIAFVGVFYYAIKTEEQSYRPENFASPFTEGTGKAIVDAGTDKNSLAIQHLSAKELGMLLPQAVADALTFNKDNYKEVLTRSQKYFTGEGYNQYVQFLTTANIEQALIAQDLQSGAFAEQEPLSLNHGVYDGVYKWVFEVPITFSFVPRNADTFTGDSAQSLNRRFLLRAQMARVVDPSFPESVKIELWQVFPPRSQK